jgi:flagellar biosynthesis GTPase FlhF
MKSIFEDMYDMEFDENVDFSSPEKVQEAIAAKLQAEQEREAHRESKRQQRKKTTKQLEKEAREKEEEQNTSKSIQEVFRKLVAVLHPDREPDETERERKTALMQRVNDAYRKKDLLQLLALQLEIEQIDQQKLNTLADDRLKHFNKILQDQLNELEQEIGEVEFPFRVQLNVSPYAKLSPDSILKALSISIRDIQFAIKDTQKELDALKDPVLLKSILKSYRL